MIDWDESQGKAFAKSPSLLRGRHVLVKPLICVTSVLREDLLRLEPEAQDKQNRGQERAVHTTAHAGSPFIGRERVWAPRPGHTQLTHALHHLILRPLPLPPGTGPKAELVPMAPRLLLRIQGEVTCSCLPILCSHRPPVDVIGHG